MVRDTNIRDQDHDPLLSLDVEQSNLLFTHSATSTTDTGVRSLPQPADDLISSVEPNITIESTV